MGLGGDDQKFLPPILGGGMNLPPHGAKVWGGNAKTGFIHSPPTMGEGIPPSKISLYLWEGGGISTPGH